ncbi:two-component response regulator DesK [Bacillus subtilis]|nr:two-component response regulator DesK [Bacillus subtilis]
MISIFIAEDQQMLLGALGSLLNLEDDMEVVGKGTTGQDAVDFVKKRQPDVCIMDIEMPGKTGLEAAEELKDTGLQNYHLNHLRQTRLLSESY